MVPSGLNHAKCPTESKRVVGVVQEIVLILGSGPNATISRNWPRRPFNRIVAINNAWRVRSDWDVAIYPDDFPKDRRPQRVDPGQRIVTSDAFVPAQNAYGGFVYAGGTMAFTAAYWALHDLRPRVLAFLGCDMVYPAAGPTHFYGNGAADPLRPDVTLQSLEAKSARLMLLAAHQGCACVNLSTTGSRLVFPRSNRLALARALPTLADTTDMALALQREEQLGYMVASGRYWQEAERFDADALSRLDALWQEAAEGGNGDRTLARSAAVRSRVADATG